MASSEPQFQIYVERDSDRILSIEGPDIEYDHESSNSVLTKLAGNIMHIDNGTFINPFIELSLGVVGPVGTAYENCLEIFNGSHAVHLHLRASFFLLEEAPVINQITNGDCKAIDVQFHTAKREGLLVFSNDEESFVRVRNVSVDSIDWKRFCTNVRLVHTN